MPKFAAPKYSDEQRDAVAHAAVDRGLSPKDVARLAAAGELEHDGRRLDPFDIPAASVGTYAYRLKQRRRGLDTKELAQQPPRDAVETLRRRLVNLVDREVTSLERKKSGTVDPERIRQTARAVREIAALPGPTDPRPPAPGQKVDGQQLGGQTRGGLAGPLLADHRKSDGKGRVNAGDEPNPTPSHTPETHESVEGGEGTASVDTTTTRQQDSNDDGTPGFVVREFAARAGAPGAGSSRG